MPLARAFCATPTRVVPARVVPPRLSASPARGARVVARTEDGPETSSSISTSSGGFPEDGTASTPSTRPELLFEPPPVPRPATPAPPADLAQVADALEPPLEPLTVAPEPQPSTRAEAVAAELMRSRTPPRTPPPPRRTPPRRMLFRNRLKPSFRVGRLGARAPSSVDSRCAATTPASRRTRARSRLGTTCTRRGATRSRETKVRWARSRRVTGSTAYTPIRRLMPVKATCDTSSTRPARRVCR